MRRGPSLGWRTISLGLHNIFPEPYVVPGHVADAKYRVLLAFKRRTVAWWFAMCLVSLVFFVWPLPLSLRDSVAGVLLGLAVLTVLRRFVTDRKAEVASSTAAALLTMPVVGTLVHALREGGVDLSLMYVVPFTLALYAILAGRDFSHFGYAVLGSAAALVCAAVAVQAKWVDIDDSALGALASVVSTVYVACDLSMLMRRRLPGEELGAAADIFRDVLNFATYAFRVVSYRRRYRFH